MVPQRRHHIRHKLNRSTLRLFFQQKFTARGAIFTRLDNSWFEALRDRVMSSGAHRVRELAKDLDRARSLRRLMDEIAASKEAPAKLVGSLELMGLMADWLDPMVMAP